MRLRYKLNLVVVGWSAMGALVLASTGNLKLSLLCTFLAWVNWTVALKGEEQDALHSQE